MANLFHPKFSLEPGFRVASAGSCFAQNICRYLQISALEFVDVEPKPKLMPDDIAAHHGYGLFSARYGNIYTVRQLFQLLNDTNKETIRDCSIWRKKDRFFDAMRPNIEPSGFRDELELAVHRLDHLKRVRQIFDDLDVFVFTLGLTEYWRDRETGTAFPTAPGIIAGEYNSDLHEFHNAGFSETYEDLIGAIGVMRAMAPGLKILLTVSPVPLSASASGQHVLRATAYSKSVLRAVAEEVASKDSLVDYFPAYEIITGSPYAAAFYHEDLRRVTRLGVDTVMSTLFAAYPSLPNLQQTLNRQSFLTQLAIDDVEDTICEEAMLDALAR